VQSSKARALMLSWIATLVPAALAALIIVWVFVAAG
jgi:hypothetical protein